MTSPASRSSMSASPLPSTSTAPSPSLPPAAPQVSTAMAIASAPSTGARRRGTRVRDAFAQATNYERQLANDPKYRKYAQAVDKTLQSFENVNEWADFITFLAKLLKCLQGYPQFAVIPHKLIVAKRLSQCLNPALPTGVHQRALDVYALILTTIGPENLRRDLPAWSSGLFPFFQYAATSVRPIVLSIYERFYVPLQESLRPATKAFILALLPGLEEDTGEFFDKVAALMDRVSGAVSPAFFFQNIWLVLVTAPKSRIAALNYLIRRLPRDDGVSAAVVGHDFGLMVRAFTATLEDAQLLVQRAILDLLLATLKIDATAFAEQTRRDDQVLLMKAVVAVVLRRDLSLSRRLYAWLLGTDDNSDAQVAYLKQHGLSLLHRALKEEMMASGTSSDRQRPFKIFISLLDKWEIGASLTDVLVLDAFAALRGALRPDDAHDELLLTGNMLFEILDPFLMWKQIFLALRHSVQGGDDDALDLVRFIVRTFKMHDEEVQKVHAPFVACALLDLVELRCTDSAPTSARLADALVLVQELLREIPSRLFVIPPSASHHDIDERFGLQLASGLYEAVDLKSASLPHFESFELYISIFQSLLRLIGRCAQLFRDKDNDDGREQIAALLSTALATLQVFLDISNDATHHRVVSWHSNEFVDEILACVGATAATPANFALDAQVTTTILSLAKSPVLKPQLRRDRRDMIDALSSKQLDYLQQGCAPCYVEATQLLWRLETLSAGRLLESMIAQRLASEDTPTKLAAFDAFGNLWRFTEDSQLPGTVFRAPMFMMLDGLKSDDLSTRRAAEGWMRCSLKSYLRILDPLLYILLDPAIAPQRETIRLADIDVPLLVYRRKFDQARLEHVLDSLLSLARFGGQGFIRISKGTFLKHSLDAQLRSRARDRGFETLTYLDGIVALLLSLLRAEPVERLAPRMRTLNQQMHAIAADLLQVLISRGEADVDGLPAIETTLTMRLWISVHRGELDLQNKLLHVLHSVIYAVGARVRRPVRAARSASMSTTATGATDHMEPGDEGRPLTMSHDAMFVRVVTDAISTQSNSAIIHHWVDFLLMTVPQYRRALQSVIIPLVDCIIARVSVLVTELRTTYLATPRREGSRASDAMDADFTVLMNALERLLLLAVAEARSLEEDSKTPDRGSDASSSVTAAGGFLGYVSGVLGTGDGEKHVGEELPTVKSAAYQRLRDSIHLMLSAWDVTCKMDSAPDVDEAKNDSRSLIAARAKVRVKKAFERVYKATPHEALDCAMTFWVRHHHDDDGGFQRRLFEILDMVAPSPPILVSSLTEKLVPRVMTSDKQRVSLGMLSPPEDAVFAFLDAFIEHLDGAAAVQVWSVCLAFERDFLTNLSNARGYSLAALRVFTTLSEKVSQTSALEDRRMRRDLQDTFLRLVDATAQSAGKLVDGPPNRRLPEINGDADSISSEKTARENDEEEKRPPPSNMFSEATSFLALRVLPDMRRFLVENDKMVSTCSNMVYYLVNPAFKSRAKTLDIDPAVFTLLTEMAKIPGTVRAWKGPVSDAFADNRFFNAPPSSNRHWRPLIETLMASDKERFVDLISRISTQVSANIFTNRELETLSRALSLRRLTYTIYTAEENKFLTQLPLIQEKLVDLLRSNVGDIVHAEVYLCLRVLLRRIGNQHLAGLWPVVLTELLRLFESLVDNPVPDGSDLLQLVLSACKFLDLTIVLQTEEFQIHQWMFVTDTVDAIYPPESWLPQAIMDRLGEILADPLRVTATGAGHLEMATAAAAASTTPVIERDCHVRRPLLTTRRIESISQLEGFFSSVSLAAYELIYQAGSKIDWSAVEASLESDIFDGGSSGSVAAASVDA